MIDRHALALTLATILLAGTWEPRAVERRAARALGPRSQKRAKALVKEIFDVVQTPYAPSTSRLARVLRHCRSFGELTDRAIQRVLGLEMRVPAPDFKPIAALRDLPVPRLTTQGDLARWLDIDLSQIDWLTDERRTLARTTDRRLLHYHYRWVRKPNGGWRLLEMPKGRTKHYQRQILREILDHLPLSPHAYAFAKRRNSSQAAAKHAGEAVVLTLDLKDFFLSIRVSKIHAIFRCIGYPSAVARMLTSLCTGSTPKTALTVDAGAGGPDRETRERHRVPHLPQGAPTSPALANFAAQGLDARLSGLARTFGANYTRYADDLTFSGDEIFSRRVDRFELIVHAIAKEEGFAINAAKTHCMKRSVRQTITGLVVNDHINVPRSDYDKLKATLINCVKLGALSQNREGHRDFRAHLDGRVAWVESVNLRRGTKLRRLFNAIRW